MTDCNHSTTNGDQNETDSNATISVSEAVLRSSVMTDILSHLSDEDKIAASMFIERLLGDFDSILTAYKAVDTSNAKR
jgi:hypothetical protein